MKKLYIDDLRKPDHDWIWVTTSEAAAYLIRESLTSGEFFDMIAFDHDLGGFDTTIPIAEMLEEFARDAKYPRVLWSIHSDNPVGRDNLKRILKRADKYWDETRSTLGSVSNRGECAGFTYQNEVGSTPTPSTNFEENIK